MLRLREALSPRLGKLLQKHVAVLVRRPSLFVLKEAQNFPANNTIVIHFSCHYQMSNALSITPGPPLSFKVMTDITVNARTHTHRSWNEMSTTITSLVYSFQQNI